MSIRYLPALTAVVAVLACGCAHGPGHVSRQKLEAVASLNTTANDQSADPDKRCRAVFSLFEQFINPGSTPSDIHEALTDTRWLAQTNVHGVYFLSGWIPVDAKFGEDTAFVISIMPQFKPSSGRPPNLGYHIYFTLAGSSSRSEQSAFDILSGQQTWDAKAVLKEFALCYPDGTIRIITKTGSRKFNMWANHRRQRAPRVRPVCISRQWCGAAAADRWAA
jgi:hypothetical protein